MKYNSFGNKTQEALSFPAIFTNTRLVLNRYSVAIALYVSTFNVLVAFQQASGLTEIELDIFTQVMSVLSELHVFCKNIRCHASS